jgi:AraC-like DNA-binding protein
VNLLARRVVVSVNTRGGGEKGHDVTEQPAENISHTHSWTAVTEFDRYVELCACDRPHLTLLTDPAAFSTTQRVGRMGPVTLQDVVFDADTSIDCGDVCSTYRVFLVRSGRSTGKHRGLAAGGGAGSAAVYAPEGPSGLQWDAGTEILLLKIARHAVEDALGDALGRQVTSQPDFAPLLPVHTAAAQSWLNMLELFTEQFFHPGGLIHQPLVGLPFVESLVRGFLWAAEHPHRSALTEDLRPVPPRAIRIAIDIIEAEAQLPLTLSSIAARSQVSVRSLQQGFRRHLGMSPMAYLREVRLRRAHQILLESDPSVVTVASVAYDWGFTNLGRFAAAHAGRYNEPPAKTLRRIA